MLEKATGVAAVPGRERRADANRSPHEAGRGFERFGVNPARQPRRGHRQLLGASRGQENRELAARVMRDLVARAHARREAAAHFRDHLVRHLVAVSPIELREILDADHQHGENRFARPRAREARFERFVETSPARVRGLASARRRLGGAEMRLSVSLQDPDDAVRARRAAASVGEPAAEILDGATRAVRLREAIGDAIGRALALVARRGVVDRLKSRGLRVGRHQFGEGRPRSPAKRRKRPRASPRRWRPRSTGRWRCPSHR